MSAERNVYTYAIRRQGAYHRRENLPCQDAFALWTGVVENNRIYIMAVADGLGSSGYDLSHYGAALATEAAVDELRSLYHEFSSSKNELFKNLQSNFPNGVLKRWKGKIARDIKKREPLIHETTDFLKRYGTTLLISMITPEGIFLGQLGDGDILILQTNGKVEKPIPGSTELIANETHSLTSPDSPRLWRIETYSIDSPALIMISTDGLSNSFESDEEFHKFARSFYHHMIEHGIHKGMERSLEQLQLPQWIDNASEKGSGDDITLGVALIEPDFIKVK